MNKKNSSEVDPDKFIVHSNYLAYTTKRPLKMITINVIFRDKSVLGVQTFHSKMSQNRSKNGSSICD